MSETMKWATLRERVRRMAETCHDGSIGIELEVLLADIDAAALAMERQERVLDAARAYGNNHLVRLILRVPACTDGLSPVFFEFCTAAIELAESETRDAEANGGADGQ